MIIGTEIVSNVVYCIKYRYVTFYRQSTPYKIQITKINDFCSQVSFAYKTLSIKTEQYAEDHYRIVQNFGSRDLLPKYIMADKNTGILTALHNKSAGIKIADGLVVNHQICQSFQTPKFYSIFYLACWQHLL